MMPSANIRIDMVRCVGHGICAHVFGEKVRLDRWGFPLIDDTSVDDQRTLRKARRAARACPRRALLIETVNAGPSR